LGRSPQDSGAAPYMRSHGVCMWPRAKRGPPHLTPLLVIWASFTAMWPCGLTFSRRLFVGPGPVGLARDPRAIPYPSALCGNGSRSVLPIPWWNPATWLRPQPIPFNSSRVPANDHGTTSKITEPCQLTRRHNHQPWGATWLPLSGPRGTLFSPTRS
jgi:hypothetical protein